MSAVQPSFKTKYYHKRLGHLLRLDRDRPPGLREAPELIVLDVEPGVTPSEKPPVRLQVRDPARRYEIYLMKDLQGFDRARWKTGFTNYRYAIPELAGKQGRAIYNDVDQIYLADPAELFDMDMKGCGQLCITE